MEESLSIKQRLIKIIFFIIAIIVCTIVSISMLVSGFNDKQKNDTSNKLKQYAQLVSYSISNTNELEDDLSLIIKQKLKNTVESIESGKVRGIEDKYEVINYSIYSVNNGQYSSVIQSDGFSDDQSEVANYFNNLSEDEQIVCSQKENIFRAFAPIKSKDNNIIGVIQINSDLSNISNDINYRSKLIIFSVSIIVLLWGIFKFTYIYSKKNELKAKYIRILVYMLIGSAMGIVIAFAALGTDFSKLTSNKIEFTELSRATSDSSGNVYVVDSGNTRIIKINKNKQYQYELNGNSIAQGKFFYAANIVADNKGNLYVLNNVMDDSGTYIAKEEILKYNSSGKFEKTIYSKEYEKEEMPLKKGNIVSFEIKGKYLNFFESQNSKISILKYDLETSDLSESFKVDVNYDKSIINDIALKDDNSIVLSTKDGRIFTIDKYQNKKMVVDSEKNSNVVLTQIETDNDGNIYCIDLGSTSIKKVNGDQLDTILSTEILQSYNVNINTDPRLEHAYYVFSINDNRITTCEHTYVISMLENGEVGNYFNLVEFSNGIIILRMIIIILLLIFIITAMSLISIKAEKIKGIGGINPVFKQCAGLVLSILIISVGIGSYYVNDYNKIFQNELENNLKRISYLKSKTINGDITKKITNVNQYTGDNLGEIKKEIKEGFNDFGDEWNSNYYSAIYKKYNNKIVTLAYSDGTDTLFLPLSFSTNDSKYVFNRVFDYGSIEYNKTVDREGKWISGFTPVRDLEGNVVAVLEIGTDENYYTIQSEKIVEEVIINIISMIAVLLFFFIEMNIFMGVIFNENKKLKLKYNVKIVRFISFLIYFILNTPLFFIAIVMEKMLQNNNTFGMSTEIATGLPLTGQMLFLVIASGVGGTITDKIGWRPVFFGGALSMIAGCCVSGISNIPLVFILGNCLLGFGLGLASIAVQSFIFYAKGLGQEYDTNEVLADFNSGSYAGANCGTLFGAMLYGKIGFSTTFFATIIICVFVSLLVFKTMPNLKNISKETENDEISRLELVKSVFNFEIINYAVLVLLPIIIVTFFVAHFFPIFAESQGLSSTTAGLGYMVQGITVIYLGPILTKVAIKHLKPKKTVVLSSIIAFGGILIFAYSPSVAFAFIAIFFLGVSEAVGQSARVNYFLNMKTSKLLGEGKSLAIFSVFENLGTIAGPTIFAVILTYNISYGMAVYGGISLILTIIFAIVTLKFRKGNKHNTYIQEKEILISEISK